MLRPGSPEGKFRDLKMDYEARSRWIHRVNDKRFSSIFTKKGKSTNDKYRHALHTLGLSGKVQFTSVEDNLEKLRKLDTAELHCQSYLVVHIKEVSLWMFLRRVIVGCSASWPRS